MRIRIGPSFEVRFDPKDWIGQRAFGANRKLKPEFQ